MDRNGEAVSRISERLSSGQRINRASDDAAGLSVVTSLDNQSRLHNRALANVNDGISLLSIADGAVSQLSGIVTSIRELAAQAANGLYSSKQRAALDAEAQRLKEAYQQVVATTSFNGVNILSSSQQIQLQVGTSGQETLAVSAAEPATQVTGQLGALSFDGSNDAVNLGDFGARPTQGTISFWMNADTITNYQNPLSFTNGSIAGGSNKAFRFEMNSSGGFSAVVGNDSGTLTGHSFTTSLTANTWYNVTLTWDSSTNNVKGYLNGSQVFDRSNTTWPSLLSNGQLGVGYQTTAARYFDGRLADVRFYSRALAGSEVSGLMTGSEPSSSGLMAQYLFTEGSGLTAADSSGNGRNGTLVNGTTWSSSGPPKVTLGYSVPSLSGFSLLTADSARLAMDAMKNTLSSISASAGIIGSQLRRLDTIASTLSARREGYQSASSRIKDTDVASDAAGLTQATIQQQVTSAILAQANIQPQIALRLLQG